MKKSSSVTLGLLAAVALTATSCSRRTEVRDCVDQNQRTVSEDLCTQDDNLRRHGYLGPRPYYWMYGGSSGGRLGDTVVGGHNWATPGVSAVSRGGFGTSMGRAGS